MISARALAALSIVSGTLWAFPAPALGAGQQPEQAEPPPTAIEEAIIEHACGALHPAGSLESDAYLGCRQNQLQSLRNDFGRDLRRLSIAERRTIDSACSALRISRGQDAYVECLTAQLAALRGHGSRAKPSAAAVAASSTAPSSDPAAVAQAVPQSPVAPPSRSFGLWIGVTLVTLVGAGAGGAFVVMRNRRPSFTCRACGVTLLEQGDLCQTCRHEAAESRRRAAAERTDQERAQQDEQRRQTEREEEQRRQQSQDEESRRRQLEDAQREEAQQKELQAQRQREEEARQQRQTDASAAQEEFDPHVVLGLPQDAGDAEIEAAYKTAREKYDLDLVADLGSELQDHFKRKGQAVERAYEMLCARRPA